MKLVNFNKTDTGFGLADSPTNFPVEETPILADATEHHDIRPITGYKSIIRSDTGDSLGVVGSKYKLVPNASYFGTVEEALRRAVPKKMFRGVQVRDRIAGSGSWAQREYVLPAYAETLKNTEFETQVGLRIIASNSYDGGSSASLLVGLIDFYCTNGVVSGRNIERAARRHSSGLDIDLLVKPLQVSIDGIQEEIDGIQNMMNTKMSVADALPLMEKHFSDRRAGQMVQRLESEMAVRGDNVFALHSALTFYSSHLTDDFPTRGDDPSFRVLEAREQEVSRIVRSPEFRKLAA